MEYVKNALQNITTERTPHPVEYVTLTNQPALEALVCDVLFEVKVRREALDAGVALMEARTNYQFMHCSL